MESPRSTMDKSGMLSARAGAGKIPVTMSIGTKSSCGAQVKSTQGSSPAYGFGTANRSNMAKRFISDEHVKKGGIHQKDNPSPCAYTIRPVATGIQSEAKTRSQPSWRFGTQKRFDTAARDRMQATPGPGAYLI